MQSNDVQDLKDTIGQLEAEIAALKDVIDDIEDDRTFWAVKCREMQYVMEEIEVKARAAQ